MFDTAALDFPLLRQDIADSTRLRLELPSGRKNTEDALHLAWLCTPPGPGSGGHTTLFRMVKGMEDRGNKCTLLLYDRHGSDMSRASAVIRQHWPWMQANVLPVPDVIEGFDGCVASSWDTAHVLASRGATTAMHRFYFIQDYEPFFYPRGSLYSLAEDSYRFGFRNIALGNMVAEALQHTAGVPADTVPFGCDGETYLLQNLGTRQGVVFYARETVDRRGTLLAKLALEEFHARHPEQVIHVYGDPVRSWQIPHRHHGKLSPSELSRLYNSSLAGLALSFTNISLVAEEMLSCGMAPVVNDHAFARKDLSARGLLWAPATPGGIAEALSRAVEQPMTASETTRAAAGARRNWIPAQKATASIIEEEVAACIR
ncbi:rhamnosyltransferase WsaF family glycosyltransferase [Arthrobacter sp. 9AX]|uniref:rhamnosyltransferase WsaF family glycosyltransferase n=1 Tax=Arthrobacter sp. 9AX TaxID=2653131 RepID=UPI001F2EE323|nr:glycosyltransferase family 1 protein [Arthrobacter sp. 9AX]